MEADRTSGSSETNGASEAVAASPRQPLRARASRSLPTDRIKFSTQIDILNAFAKARANVSSEDLARFTSVSAATAGLNNNFFLESGLIERVKKGRYDPAPIVLDFARAYGFASDDAQRADAAHRLAPTLRGTWYYATVADRLDMGPATRDDLVRQLAHAAGAETHHKPQLESILDWLAFAGLLEFDGDVASLVGSAQSEEPVHGRAIPLSPTLAVDADVARPHEHAGSPASRQGAAGEPVVQTPHASPAVLAFSLDLSLTADDLALLTPEQIRAIYEAVGLVASIKMGLNK